MRQLARTVVGALITIVTSSFIVFAALSASPERMKKRLQSERNFYAAAAEAASETALLDCAT